MSERRRKPGIIDSKGMLHPPQTMGNPYVLREKFSPGYFALGILLLLLSLFACILMFARFGYTSAAVDFLYFFPIW